jgi:hypothetical protein
MIKKRGPTSRELAMRQIACDYCGKKHFVKDGDWVITASNKILCDYNTDDDCFHRNKRDANERRKI